MEIGQFLRSRPRMTALALLFPLLAALGAYVFLTLQPQRYTATADVSVPSSDADSSSRVGIFIANFSELATSSTVLASVSEATQVPQGDLTEGVEVSRIGNSSLFSVIYTGQGRDTVEGVVRSVIDTTFARIVSVERTEAALVSATEAYEAAEAERTAYQDEIGSLQPSDDYADLSSRIRGLQLAPVLSPADRAAITRLTEEREVLVPQIRRLNELDRAVEDAASRREEARASAATVQRDADEAPQLIQELTVTEASTAATVLQGVGVAAVAGLLVGIAVLVLPDLVRRRPTPSPSAAGDGAPSRPTSLDEARQAS